MTTSDVAGITPDGRSIVVNVAVDDRPTLLAFLSSRCRSCGLFWRAFAEQDAATLADHPMRVVLVTHGPEHEDPAALTTLAPSGVPTVMSESAWSDYEVPGSPYFVLVNGPSAGVVVEGTASSWRRMIGLVAGTNAGDPARREDRSMPRSWLDPRIQIRPVHSGNRGLFACDAIPVGAAVLIMCGRIATDAEAKAHSWRFRGNRAIQIDDDVNLLQTSDDASAALRHSCDPNVWFTDRFTFGARRDIEAGDELTVDHATFTVDPDWVMPCSCGSTVCRGSVSGYDWSLPALQGRYAGHFSQAIAGRTTRRAAGPTTPDRPGQEAMYP